MSGKRVLQGGGKRRHDDDVEETPVAAAGSAVEESTTARAAGKEPGKVPRRGDEDQWGPKEGEEEEEWEDVTSSDGDDDDVDVRFDQMKLTDEEIVDEDEEDEEDEEDDEEDAVEESNSTKKGTAAAVASGNIPKVTKSVHFDAVAAKALQKAAAGKKKGTNAAEDDDDDDVEDDDDDDLADNTAIWRRDKAAKKAAKGASNAAEEEDDGPVKLSFNNKAYDCFFQLRSEYPCLSFDVLRDNEGDARTKYPLTMYLVCGSQAEKAQDNQLYIIKVSNLWKTKHDLGSDEDSDDDDDEQDGILGAPGDEDGNESDDEDEDAEEVNGGEPLIDYKTVKHHGTVNRLRCNPHATTMVASWSESGHVQVFDVVNEMRSMSDFVKWSQEKASSAMSDAKKGNAASTGKNSSLKFISSSDAHKTEGYGLGWSQTQAHRFASGDCNGTLMLWCPTEDGRWLPTCLSAGTPAKGHNAHSPSIEEIRFSPSQLDVLMATRAGGAVEIWDTRSSSGKATIWWQADPTDINVGDWNPTITSSHLFVTGADSGMVALWDLRVIQKAFKDNVAAGKKSNKVDADPVQMLRFHEGTKITSVEFSRHNESVLSVTTDDGQCTLWDMSLERDPDEEAEVMGKLFGRPDTVDLPDQLMFQHQGLYHPKEAHFHPQIPGMTITADFEGLNFFKPMNWKSLMK